MWELAEKKPPCDGIDAFNGEKSVSEGSSKEECECEVEFWWGAAYEYPVPPTSRISGTPTGLHPPTPACRARPPTPHESPHRGGGSTNGSGGTAYDGGGGGGDAEDKGGGGDGEEHEENTSEDDEGSEVDGLEKGGSTHREGYPRGGMVYGERGRACHGGNDEGNSYTLLRDLLDRTCAFPPGREKDDENGEPRSAIGSSSVSSRWL